MPGKILFLLQTICWVPALCCFTESGRDGDITSAMRILQSKDADQINPSQSAQEDP